MARHKDRNWELREKDANGAVPNDDVKMALLMDLRDELKAIRYTMESAGRVLHAIHHDLTYKPRISRKQAARVLARARNRKRAKP